MILLYDNKNLILQKFNIIEFNKKKSCKRKWRNIKIL